MNKPVAWMVAEMVFTIEESAIEMAKVYGNDVIPLYTHPVKELMDEEIIELWKQAIQDGYTDMIIHDSQTVDTKKTMFEFAKAILRKAQEK